MVTGSRRSPARRNMDLGRLYHARRTDGVLGAKSTSGGQGADLLWEVMRLGILGPAKGDLHAIAAAATYLADEVKVDKVLYLSSDGALDRVAWAWGRGIVGGAEPHEDALFARAVLRCSKGSPETIDAFVQAERERARLRMFTSLPDGHRRTIEFFDGRVALFVYDKSILDEEDLMAANLLVFGRSREPQLKRVGTRMFVSPGPIGVAGGGLGVIEEAKPSGVAVKILDARGVVSHEDTLGGGSLMSGIKMRVQSGKNG